MDTNNTDNKDPHSQVNTQDTSSNLANSSVDNASQSVQPAQPTLTVPNTLQSSANLTHQEMPSINSETTNIPNLVNKTNEDTSQAHNKRGIPLVVLILFLIISFISGLLSAVAYFQGQLQKTDKADNLTQNVKQVVPDVIVIGMDATAPPMESVNEQGGLVGYDVDLGYRIANELGVKAEFRNITWDEVFPALENKKIDMIISSVTINDERKLKYNFSEPYINAGQVIVSRKDAPISKVDELNGKKISVQTGTTNETEALKYTAKENVLSFAGFEDAAKALSDGKSDAMISDLTMAKGFISQYENLKITSDPFTNDYYGVVIHKDNVELKEKVDEAISALRVNGILADLKQKWLE